MSPPQSGQLEAGGRLATYSLSRPRERDREGLIRDWRDFLGLFRDIK